MKASAFSQAFIDRNRELMNNQREKQRYVSESKRTTRRVTEKKKKIQNNLHVPVTHLIKCLVDMNRAFSSILLSANVAVTNESVKILLFSVM